MFRYVGSSKVMIDLEAVTEVILKDWGEDANRQNH
jgi:hypothetical protein